MYLLDNQPVFGQFLSQFSYFFFFFKWLHPKAFGSSQASVRIGTAAASLTATTVMPDPS